MPFGWGRFRFGLRGKSGYVSFIFSLIFIATFFLFFYHFYIATSYFYSFLPFLWKILNIANLFCYSRVNLIYIYRDEKTLSLRQPGQYHIHSVVCGRCSFSIMQRFNYRLYIHTLGYPHAVSGYEFFDFFLY